MTHATSTTSNAALCTPEQAAARIKTGRPLLVAGDEGALRQLPEGNWIGGTIPYFLSAEGGVVTRDRVMVTEAPGEVVASRVEAYTADQLSAISEDSPDVGYTLLLVPAASDAHRRYAHEAPEYPGTYMKAILGWITGMHLDDLGTVRAKIVDGRDSTWADDGAVALHVTLPEGTCAEVGMVNLFEPRTDADLLRFDADGFSTREVTVNGEKRNFAEYLAEIGADKRWPLVADYMGTAVNVSFQRIDGEEVFFYAPVFTNVTYRLARPLEDYGRQFQAALKGQHASLACSCILNYLAADLEGKPALPMQGPATFGEIAHQLVNQTTVYLEIHEG